MCFPWCSWMYAIFSLVKTNLPQFTDWFQRWQRYTSLWVQAVQSSICIAWSNWTWMGEWFSWTPYIPYWWKNYARHMQQRYRYALRHTLPSLVFQCFIHSLATRKLDIFRCMKLFENRSFKIDKGFVFILPYSIHHYLFG